MVDASNLLGRRSRSEPRPAAVSWAVEGIVSFGPPAGRVTQGQHDEDGGEGDEHQEQAGRLKIRAALGRIGADDQDGTGDQQRKTDGEAHPFTPQRAAGCNAVALPPSAGRAGRIVQLPEIRKLAVTRASTT
jgi:hypothetical protein